MPGMPARHTPTKNLTSDGDGEKIAGTRDSAAGQGSWSLPMVGGLQRYSLQR